VDDGCQTNEKAGVPAEIGYRPKWQIALEMLRQARAEGFSGPVLADSAYGTVRWVEHSYKELEKQGIPA
jgi:SRSO17 transposase